MFSLRFRKVLVISLIAAVFMMANAWLVVDWLSEKGLIEWADWFKSNFLTGTALTVIAAMLILYVSPAGTNRSILDRCPVCGSRIIGRKNYCPDCGSKL
jgi:hypothetical protein